MVAIPPANRRSVEDTWQVLAKGTGGLRPWILQDHNAYQAFRKDVEAWLDAELGMEVRAEAAMPQESYEIIAPRATRFNTRH